MRSLRDCEQSSLWNRLDELSRSDEFDRAALDDLKSSVREPVDGQQERSGTQSWSTDLETGQQWLCVTDNGVGMTEEVIKNYFTQIGKNYYRSPERLRTRLPCILMK